MQHLPSNLLLKDYVENYRLQPQLWKQAIEETCVKHSISTHSFEAFTDGSNLIASVGDRYVVKLFPPFHVHQWKSEYKSLQYLNGKLNIAIPELIAHGVRDDNWTYIIITKLKGVTLESIWHNCMHNEKAIFLNHIGSIMSSVHSVPVGNLHTLEPQWNIFLETQLTKYCERHKRHGMPDWFTGTIETFINENISLFLPLQPASVILTCEYTPFNLLVEGNPGNWKITGMIDFGDVMVGYNEYDLIGPIMFLGEGNPELVQCLLKGYGYTDEQMNKDLRRRLMLLQVLHRYSNFKDQLRINGWQERVKSIAELEELIWPL